MCTSTTGAGRPHGAPTPTGSAPTLAGPDPVVPRPAEPPALTPAPVQVPAPTQAADLGRLRLTELRVLRRDARRAETDLSYVRRLVQGRIDILRAELEQRSADLPLGAPPGPGGPGGTEDAGGRGGRGGPVGTGGCGGAPTAPPTAPSTGPAPLVAPLVARLSRILADQPAPQRSSARHVTLRTPHSAEYGRLAAAMLAEVALSDLAARTDDELRAAMSRLVGYEQQVSRRRQQVQHTADGCGAEIARRYREGEAQVDDLLA